MRTEQDWVQELNLQAHPEGGYFSETYRSEGKIAGDALPEGFSGDRVFGTAIYYLLGPKDKSHLHRLQADEVWHFYAGGRLEISVIHPDGRLETIALGSDPAQGERFQAVVSAHAWFGARPVAGTYALVGCTMAPGFEFSDFELAERDALTKQFPEYKEIIQRLT